jgi:hypothetical protein
MTSLFGIVGRVWRRMPSRLLTHEARTLHRCSAACPVAGPSQRSCSTGIGVPRRPELPRPELISADLTAPHKAGEDPSEQLSSNSQSGNPGSNSADECRRGFPASPRIAEVGRVFRRMRAASSEARDAALPIETPRAARRAHPAERSDQAWIMSGRPKVASAPGVRKVVISSMRAPRRVSTLMPCGMKLPPSPSQA